MSFLKKLFGGGSKGGSGPKILGESTFEGLRIVAIEMKAGQEYQLCGRIERSYENGDMDAVQFIRADKLPNAEMAEKAILAKGEQIISERGKTLFDGGENV
ncbi:HlyU family transcriptional regulator [Maritalea mediterranea]|uniref:HlyU family transcriptional regulator n=1 Tax=Maritalea mediterranea TaxID=2909667 RepID=A0ABS9E816_9HYPH|nr:HlyU family transcriptional regulator [Maritalea mediterranea]MCF4098987.1 HlyU family transcriptional regulator [Maritalea mediterranea]